MTKKNTISDIKKALPSMLLRIINKAKKIVKNDDTWKKICKEYGVEPEIIDFIPMYFKNLDVSAKTERGIVWLNYKLLLNGFSLKDVSYIIHEGTHYLQQTCGTKPTKSSNDGSYLDNPYEEESFQYQAQFIADNLGDNEAEKYVDELLEYHDFEGKEEKDKKEVLMSKV